MSDDAPSPRARRRLWPRIAAILFVVALVGLGIAWLVQPKGVTATALLEVRNDSPSIVASPRVMDNSEYETIKKTQVALLKQKFVLSSAVVNPGIAALSVFAGKADLVEWLQDHLEVGYPQNGEILEIKLR